MLPKNRSNKSVQNLYRERHRTLSTDLKKNMTTNKEIYCVHQWKLSGQEKGTLPSKQLTIYRRQTHRGVYMHHIQPDKQVLTLTWKSKGSQ
jgi:hypothetical protein